MKLNIYYCTILISFSLVTAQTLSAQVLEVTFHNTFGGEPVQLKKQYTNAHGEQLNISVLDYFISNVALTKKDGSVYLMARHYGYG